MITGVGSVAILAHNPNKLAEWYRDKLDFEIVGNVGHAVHVKPKGSESLLLHLCGECESWENDKPGGRTGIWFHCGEVTMKRIGKSGAITPASDPIEVEKTYLELKKRGVEFTEELTTTDWGKYAILKDLEGNEFEIS